MQTKHAIIQTNHPTMQINHATIQITHATMQINHATKEEPWWKKAATAIWMIWASLERLREQEADFVRGFKSALFVCLMLVLCYSMYLEVKYRL